MIALLSVRVSRDVFTLLCDVLGFRLMQVFSSLIQLGSVLKLECLPEHLFNVVHQFKRFQWFILLQLFTFGM